MTDAPDHGRDADNPWLPSADRRFRSRGRRGAGSDRTRRGKSSRGSEKPPLPLWKEALLLLVTAVVLALIIKTFFVQAFYIPSGSMEQTLDINDRILVQKVSYWFGDVHRGDVVVFDDPGGWLTKAEDNSADNLFTKALAAIGLYPTGGHLVKRVIGVGGDHVKCQDGSVWVNGTRLHETSYVTLAKHGCNGSWSVIVPKNDLWVMGDNRTNSADSRAHMGDPGGGFVPEDDVVGQVFVTIWPVDRWRTFDDPQTFDQPGINSAGPVGH